MSRARTIADILTAATTMATDAETAAAITAHAALSDPHTGYVLESQYSAKGTILVGTGSGTLTAQTLGTDGQYLQADSTQADGVKWSTVDALPSQTGNTGKYLTTNGTSASWATITTDPSPTSFMLMGA